MCENVCERVLEVNFVVVENGWRIDQRDGCHKIERSGEDLSVGLYRKVLRVT